MNKKLILLSVTILLLTSYANCEDEEVAEPQEETRMFKAEVSRMMDIIINSLYSQKEIFLREALSNASDALDKIRFMSIANPEVLNDEPELHVKIEIDPVDETISLTDTGIGMTKNDLINHLGTVASSGTTQFLEAMAKGGNLNLIGQFGVGFYSLFLVADKVTVISKNNDDDQYIWESSAGETFTLKKDTKGPFLNRGTKIIMKVRNDMKQFLEVSKIKSLAKKYSEFINFPILLYTSKEVTKEVEDSNDSEKIDETEKTDENKELDQSASEDKKKTRTVTETVWDWEKVNESKALWLKPSEDIEDSEYKKFYKAFTKDTKDPFSWLHFRAEGEVEFTALLYIPKASKRSQHDWEKDEKRSPVKLYVRRVLISDQFTELLPNYLEFITGVVDSDDLPLNVSRETLQQVKTIKTIKKKIVKKILDRLERYSKEKVEEERESIENLTEIELDEREKRIQAKKEDLREKFTSFFHEFGRSLKLGVVEDIANRQKIAEIIKFYSTFNDTKTLVSFEDYISRGKTDQKDIYYIAGEKLTHLKSSPMIKGLIKKGYEVLLLDDPIDEYCLQTLGKFNDRNLVNVAKAGFEVPRDEDEKKLKEKLNVYYQPLMKWLKELFTDSIESVRVNPDMINDPLLILAPEHGYSANFEKIVKSQAVNNRDERLDQLESMKKILEINPYHPFIKELHDRVRTSTDKETEETAKIMVQVAMMNSGFTVKDPSGFASRFYRVMADALGVSRDVDRADLDFLEIEDAQPKVFDQFAENEEQEQEIQMDEPQLENDETPIENNRDNDL